VAAGAEVALVGSADRAGTQPGLTGVVQATAQSAGRGLTVGEVVQPVLEAAAVGRHLVVRALTSLHDPVLGRRHGTRSHHIAIGLVLAFLLGPADIAFLATPSGDSGDKPPVCFLVVSVLVGLATLVLVVLAWRAPTWPMMITIIGLWVLSALGDIPGLFQDAAVVTVSLIHLAISAACIALLPSRPETCTRAE
jgi:hypothetical protein